MDSDSPPKFKTSQQHPIGQYVLVPLVEPARQSRCRQRSTRKIREEDPTPRAGQRVLPCQVRAMDAAGEQA